MSKRLKKRIQEVCGLSNLGREDKVRRASEILSDTDLKQAICNKLVGTSFKDIEKALKDIVQDKPHTSKEDAVIQELEEIAPYKLNPPSRPAPKTPSRVEYLLDPAEVNRLIAASEKPYEGERNPEKPHTNYPTWTEAEVNALVNGDYDPARFKRRR